MTDLQLFIFDVDGTLIDSQAHILGSMSAAFRALGYPEPGRAEVLGIVGLSLPVAIARLLPDASVKQVDSAVAAYKSAFMDLRVSGDSQALSPLYPGVAEGLVALAGRTDCLLGVATGKSRRGLDAMLELHGFERTFVTQQVADHHPSKPHPSMIETALRETGVAATDATMIGDTTFDMEMAVSAKVRAVGVDWGYHPAETLVQAGAERVVTDFAALLRVLDQPAGVTP